MPQCTHLPEISSYEIKASIDALENTALAPFNPMLAPSTLLLSEQAPLVTPLSRPRLTPPPSETRSQPVVCELRLIAALSEFRSVADDLVFASADSLEVFKKQVKALSKENIGRIHDAAKRAEESAFWSMLKKIASSLLAALSIVIGSSILGTGGGALVGGAMIASGVLSLTNLSFTEFGIWDWVAKKLGQDDEQLRNQIAAIFPAVVGVACGIVGVVGSVGAAISGIELLNKFILIAQGTLATFQAGTNFGDGYAQYRFLNARADLSHTRTQLSVNQTNTDLFTENLSDYMKMIGRSGELATQVVGLAIEAHDIATQELSG